MGNRIKRKILKAESILFLLIHIIEKLMVYSASLCDDSLCVRD